MDKEPFGDVTKLSGLGIASLMLGAFVIVGSVGMVFVVGLITLIGFAF